MQKINFTILAALALVLCLANASALSIVNVDTNPSKVAPGETAGLEITVENNLKENVENVNVMLDLNELPFAPFDSGSEKSVDKIKEGDEEIFSFKLIADYDAKAGIYKIPVKISYFINGQKFDKNSSIGVIIDAKSNLKVFAEGYLIEGMEKEITIRIINDGLSDVKFLSVSIGNPSGIRINSPIYDYIGSLDSDDFDSVQLKIFAETKTSTIILPVTLAYSDAMNNNFVKQENLIVNVYSKEEAKAKGLIAGTNYTLYIVIALIVLAFLFFRWRKRRRLKHE